MHLSTGCCYTGCQVCHGAPGIAQARGLEGWSLNAEARAIWNQHRDTLLECWRDPGGHRDGTSNFSPEFSRGTGQWFPCFAEVVFDGAPWPKWNKEWPKAARRFWESIDDALEAGGTIPG